MTRILFVTAALLASSSAFAETYDANGPIRHGNRCWAVSDSRGFGYWDTCASRQEIQEVAKKQGVTVLIDQARSQRASTVATDTGGSGGGGGGGGGR